MDEGSAVALAAVVAVLAQSMFMIVESRRVRLDRAKTMRAAARLVRDEISGSMEALHQGISRKEWWSDELDSEPTLTEEDRRLLAANADAETLRRSFGSMRRFTQLRRLRRRALGEESRSDLTRAELVEVVAVFLDLATARRLLSPFTGYGPAAFSRPLEIDGEVLQAALRAAAIDSAEGLYRPIELSGDSAEPAVLER